jgi:phospholipid/cholesterol/gamma-HCH transport system permease protein
MLLEFSSTILCLILAGKVGSNIASEIGTMRITEQIDAMEMMGVNSANYLILPKITAFITMMPILVIFSVASALIGGYLMALLGGVLTVDEYVYGITYAFIEFHVPYAIIKSMIFGFVITSVSAYYGYTTHGGALEVGKASTNAVVNSSVIILFLDIFLTKLMLS